MVCHGELARRRPHPAHLTSFYLMVSVGGAIGGLLIGFVAPYCLQRALRSPGRVLADRFPARLPALARAREKTDGAGSFLDAPYDKPVIGVADGRLWSATSSVGSIHARIAADAAFLDASYDPWVLLGIAGVIALYVIWRGRGLGGRRPRDRSPLPPASQSAWRVSSARDT